MRILLINPPHTAIGSRIPREQLPPLGLLAIGGPLIDDGHDVRLLDCEFGPMPVARVIREAANHQPDLVLIGHSGSSSAHPTAIEIARGIKQACPEATLIYGGVFPTYHWKDILEVEDAIDIIVRGEGEETCRRTVAALASQAPLWLIPGLAFRHAGKSTATAPAPMIRDLDAYRVGWELIDHSRYGYWGGKRGVVIQFSRGCPHLCTYCGQRGFWTRWRHRDPKKFAAEIARLHREHGVELFNLADENPTTSPKAWREFLEAMIAEDVKVIIIGSTRADDIVRDADILPLYRKAGVERFLLGMEHTDEDTLALIRKGGTTKSDREAIRLMRKNKILSLATFVIGFEEETDRDYWRALKQLVSYDPDQINVLYTTPHRWTPYFAVASARRIIQTDQRLWDYKHQVMATRHMPPWRVFLWQKAIEALVQLRPKALARTYFNFDPAQRHGMRWYACMGRRVWLHEIWNFLFHDKRIAAGPTVGAYWGAPLSASEDALDARKPVDSRTPVQVAAE